MFGGKNGKSNASAKSNGKAPAKTTIQEAIAMERVPARPAVTTPSIIAPGTLILGGIKSVTQTHAVTGLPLLSQIPVLGIFFGSHSNKRQETENAMFVIPSVVETVPKSSLDLVKNALAVFDDYTGDIDSVNTFDRVPPSAKKEQ